jgi:hypothetical protein
MSIRVVGMECDSLSHRLLVDNTWLITRFTSLEESLAAEANGLFKLPECRDCWQHTARYDLYLAVFVKIPRMIIIEGLETSEVTYEPRRSITSPNYWLVSSHFFLVPSGKEHQTMNRWTRSGMNPVFNKVFCRKWTYQALTPLVTCRGANIQLSSSHSGYPLIKNGIFMLR